MLELIKDNSKISAIEITKILGLTRDGTRYHLNKLKESVKIKFIDNA